MKMPTYAQIRKLSNVRRLSGTRIISSYNLVEHSYRVLALFLTFFEKIELEVSANDVKAVMFHDILEIETGDLLYPAKGLNKKTEEAWDIIENEVSRAKGLEEYSDSKIHETLGITGWLLFKLSDMFELYLFLENEILLGNRTPEVVEIFHRCIEILSEEYLPRLVKFGISDFFIEYVRGNTKRDELILALIEKSVRPK